MKVSRGFGWCFFVIFECACDSSVFFVLCLIASKAIWAIFMAFAAFKVGLSLFFACELQFFVVWCSGGKTIQGWICDWSDRAIGGYIMPEESLTTTLDWM